MVNHTTFLHFLDWPLRYYDVKNKLLFRGYNLVFSKKNIPPVNAALWNYFPKKFIAMPAIPVTEISTRASLLDDGNLRHRRRECGRMERFCSKW